MARSEQKTQKKLAAKKRKQRKEAELRSKTKQLLASTAGIVASAAEGEVIECLMSVPESKLSGGLRVISIARRGQRGHVVWCVFLVDVWCLGVKNCVARLVSQAEYIERRAEVFVDCDYGKAAPEVAHAIVQGGIEYAQSLGLSPHPDCRKCMPIWHGIPVGELPADVEFGVDGMPWYVSGPHEDVHKRLYILNMLRDKVGTDNFRFVLHSDSAEELEAFSAMNWTAEVDEALTNQMDAT